MNDRLKKVCLAVAFPAALLVFAEGVARVLVEAPTRGRMFTESVAPGGRVVWQRNPHLAEPWHPPYSLAKSENTVRVACVGGSTVEGIPFPELAFPQMIQRYLRAIKPAIDFEVIGCGVGGQYSRGEVAVFEEVLALEPDVVVLYSAHNEFHPQNVKDLGARAESPVSTAILEFVRSLRLATAIMNLAGGEVESKTNESLKDKPPTRRPIDGPEFGWVLDAFRSNVEHFARRCEELGITLVLCTSVSNIRDFAPMFGVFRAGLAESETERVRALVAESDAALAAGRAAEALALAEQARSIDDTPATVSFALGRALLATGRVAEAKRALCEARDHDGRLNRAHTDFNAAIRDIADRTPALLADVEESFAAAAKDGIVGNDWIVDNVHPKVEGQALIARVVVESLARANNVITPADLSRLPPLSSLTGQLGPAEIEERVGFANLLLALEKGHGGDSADLARLHFENARAIEERAATMLGLGLVEALDGKLPAAKDLLRRAHAADPKAFAEYAESAERSKFVADLFRSCGVEFRGGRVEFLPGS